MWRDGLTVIALESKVADRHPDYVTFADASAQGSIDVHEAPAQSVPTVEAVTGPTSVLVLGGETIIGGGQNRIINISILLKAAATTQIPVSCLEVGRWTSGGRFAAARPVDYGMRRMVAEQVSRNAAASAAHRFAADQGAIWGEIGHRQARANMHSPTAALHDVYAAEERSVEDLVRSFPMPAATRGVAIGLFDRLIGFDLFDSSETLERQWQRLVGSAASALLDQQRLIDAHVVPPPRHRRLHSQALNRMLERGRGAVSDAAVAPSVGEGTDVRFAGDRVVGSALVHSRRLVHLSLFRRD
jgi:hypothetical protein